MTAYRKALATIAAFTIAFAPIGAARAVELVLAIGGEPDEGFDPMLGWGRYGQPLFQSTLLQRNAAQEAEPDLATAWSLSADRRVWTITIRPDARFSDGSKLTATDVAFTFNQAARGEGPLDLSALDRAEVVNETTVTLRLRRPWVTFMENFFSLGIVPAALYTPNYGEEPIGSGPYRLVSWTPGEQLIVEPNPYYYGPEPQFEQLTFLFSAHAQTDAVNLVSIPPSLAEATPAGFTRVVVETVDHRGIALPVLPYVGGVDEDGERLGNSVTADRAIRQAINLGLDRQALVDGALNGFGKPAFGPADGQPWANPQAHRPYDLAAAQALLDEAGWTVGLDGIRAKNGLRASFPLNFPEDDVTREALATDVAGQLRLLGLEARPVGLSWAAIRRVMHSEPVLFGWGGFSPLEVYSLYGSAWGGVGAFNPGYFSNPQVDDYFSQAQGASSLEASYPFWKRAEWDGETGYGPRGEAVWAWLVSVDHLYFVDQCLDLGPPRTEPHDDGWPILAGIADWRWTCQ
jgi:peptide/nickel transport system substrate-binding protein